MNALEKLYLSKNIYSTHLYQVLDSDKEFRNYMEGE